MISEILEEYRKEVALIPRLRNITVVTSRPQDPYAQLLYNNLLGEGVTGIAPIIDPFYIRKVIISEEEMKKNEISRLVDVLNQVKDRRIN